MSEKMEVHISWIRALDATPGVDITMMAIIITMGTIITMLVAIMAGVIGAGILVDAMGVEEMAVIRIGAKKKARLAAGLR